MPASVVTRDALAHDREAWDALAAQQPLASPFQRSWWLSAVAPHDTTYLLVHHDDRLIGGLAMRERRVAGVRRYGAPGPTVLCPDHLDVLAAGGCEDEVARAVGAWFERPGARVVDLRGVIEDSLLARAVGTAPRPMDVAPYQPLPTSPETYLAGRSANFRRSVRRAGRRLADGGFTHRRVAASALPDAFAAFRALHERREGRGPLLAELATLQRAVTEGAALGEARVDLLATDDEVAAVTIAFVVAGRLSLYQVARSLAGEHDGAGNVLLVAVVEDAVAHGCREVDLLRGGEDYKSSYADRSRTLGRLRTARGTLARAQLAAEDAARRVSATLRSPGP